VQILAGIVIILIGFVLILSLTRMVQREIAKGKRPDTGMWLLFMVIVIIAGAGIAAGAYLLFTQ
jgi:hypothetical protein